MSYYCASGFADWLKFERLEMKNIVVVILAFSLLSRSAIAADGNQTPKHLVLAFYKLALTDFKPKEAFAEYVAPDFIEHSADSPSGTAQSTVDFLTQLIKTSPQPKWEVVRAIAEGDMVFLHVRFTPAAGASPIIVGEIFRVRNGRIAEHWDIIQHSPEHPVNQNSLF